MTTQTNISIEHVEVAPLGARFSRQGRERISEFLRSFVSFEATLGLLYGTTSLDESGQGSWSMTAYGPQTVDDLVKMYAGFGAIVCYDLDGIRVVVPQLAHIAELESGELEFSGDRICSRAVSET
jgi:hypothetical protein